MADLSFLCTFIPGSEKSTDGTFVPVELSFHGTFARWNFRSSGVNIPRTFAPIVKKRSKGVGTRYTPRSSLRALNTLVCLILATDLPGMYC